MIQTGFDQRNIIGGCEIYTKVIFIAKMQHWDGKARSGKRERRS
jgi:hypothetical protein